MKALYCSLLALVLSLPNYAQTLQEDFESYATGTAGSTIGFTDTGNGTSAVADGSNGNATQVLLSSNTSGGDHFLRSPLFPVLENETYTFSFDISLTNTVYMVRIRTEDAAGNNIVLSTTDVTLVPGNGDVNPSNPSRIENVTANSFATTTATFSVPAGMTGAQIQIYQFGVNSFMLDNISTERIVPDLVYDENFEAYSLGTAGSAIGYTDLSNGSSEIASGTNGNSTQVLLASNTTGGDHFLRSPLFPVEAEQSYRLTLDISVTNTVYFVRIRTEDDAGNNTIMPITNVELSTTNGTINPTNAARIENVTSNSFGTTTATFTIPAGITKAQFQVYQFGVNSFMLDNVQVEKIDIAPPPNWSSEAEEGILSGAAFVASGCGNASNEAFVRLESDSENQVTFGNINVNSSGSYELTIDYFYKSSSTYLQLYVNGFPVKEKVFLPASWCFEGPAASATVRLPLQAGTNYLTLAPVQGQPSPFLDRLELSEFPVHQWFAEAETGSLSGGATVVSGCDNASEQAFVKLDKSTSNTLSFNNVEVTDAGYYKIGFAYFGKGATQSLDVFINGVATRITSLPVGNFCFEGAARYAAINAELAAGSNSIEIRPIGGDTPSPLIDWIEAYAFTPPIAALSLTKQRLEPGETVEIIVSTDGTPVENTETFALSVNGLTSSQYQLSAATITIEAGGTEGFVQFTPNAGLGETEIQIAATTASQDVIFNNAQVNALITSIPQTIYVSATDGDDSNDGYSPATPLKTLARTTALGQITGDQVLFKAGDVFNGRLVVSASGTVEAPLVISSYGTGEQPILDGSMADDGQGSFAETIVIINKSNIEISDLHITNPRSSSRTGVPDTYASGILLLNDSDGITGNFTFRNLTITDVFSVSDINLVPFNAIQVTGIFAETSNSNPGSVKYMENIIVEDCYFSRIGKIGFWARRRFNGSETIERDLIKNREIIFRNNTVWENGGSGIVLSNAYNALVESNVFHATGAKTVPDKMIGRGSGAWFFSCTNIIAQHNISRHVRGSGDSYGMHIDYGNKNVLFQYNYSEDSEGGFVEILGDNINSIWRYNISVNDGLRDNKGNTLWISDYAGNNGILSAGNYIYNNSVYVGNGFTPDISINGEDAFIYNNIFQTENNSTIGAELLLSTNPGPLDVSNNLFFGDINTAFTQLDASAIQADPKYVEAGKLEADGYRLFKDSPAIKAGEERPHPAFPEAGTGIFSHIPETPATDFFGNPLVDENGIAITPIGAYAGNGLKVNNLKSYADCDYDVAGELQWLVVNPNSFAVEVSWSHDDDNQSGVINASPGNNYFTTDDVPGLNKEYLTIEWMDESGLIISKKLKSTDCYEAEPAGISSHIQRVNSAGNRYDLKVLFPNPISKAGTLNLLVSSEAYSTANIQLTDLHGRVLHTIRREMVSGDNLLQIPLSNIELSAELFLVQVEIGGRQFSRKVLIAN
ncbi:right-handed parallel beta-helix repeat-containing protein [Flavilitoribacter nigricans]|uniref:CBM6 domain-containing protein n=1 Tax=Flavilitoribacter nigricans (strain ATCC 23147 / DSM 23189 / NBRC 102662 / NCIMB 1420 / SS-2) TaxID=1122177 RepID=A0A2D0N1M2_FLAN2|nr:right-handed parallel beta-helix repeat-containing protein [Flavilitoribacter nigricans]PHN02414.1 hypothetical protein CRP01_32035 [Flavilitoribacter nigricans DSM 23189 = NBRC 102662]